MAKKTGQPTLPDVKTIIAAGINPRTGLPIKMSSTTNNAGVGLKNDIFTLLNIVDRQDAINRYSWKNLPNGLTSQMIEKILYEKGQAAFFYMKENEKFYFLPYALNGTIDVYGRYTGISPVPLGASKDADGNDKPWIQGLIKKPIYEMLEEVTLEDFEDDCVLLSDYNSMQPSGESVIARNIVNKPLLNVMSNIIPFMNTALANSTGVEGVRVADEDCQSSVQAANDSILDAALNGQRYIPVTGTMEMQDLGPGATAKGADFMQALESLDNFRLSLYGLKNGGLFQKKAHMLEDEQALASGNVGLVMQDGLTLRQEFCNRVNSIWPLGIWCEISETVAGIDKNMDGEVSDEQDGQEPIDMQVGGDEDVA